MLICLQCVIPVCVYLFFFYYQKVKLNGNGFGLHCFSESSSNNPGVWKENSIRKLEVSGSQQVENLDDFIEILNACKNLEEISFEAK